MRISLLRRSSLRRLVIGKDGGEKLRKVDETLSLKELYNLIDAMPMRRREMKEQGE